MSRRDNLAQARFQSTTNACLWLDKYLEGCETGKEYRQKLVDQIADIPEPACYSNWFERWRDCLSNLDALCREATVNSRLSVGLGEESVLETSISLNRTFGVPYIPGTALKGLAASFARKYLGDDWDHNKDNGAYSIMFGSTDSAGHVRFFDAMPFPGTGKLLPDIVTVHHSDYYQNGTRPPADWDDPVPVPFLAAKGKYLIAVAGHKDWANAALSILAKAFEQEGVGAKTNIGYGRLSMQSETPKTPDEALVDSFVLQINAIPNSSVAGAIFGYVERWRSMDVSPAQKRYLAQVIVAKVRMAGREKHSKDKAWYKELLQSAEKSGVR